MKSILMFLFLGVSYSLPISTSAQTIVWERTYALGSSIVGFEKADSGYIFFGQSEFNFRDISELVKTDTSGNILWNINIQFDTAIDDLYSFDIVKSPNEWSYYLSGRFRIDGTGLGDYVIKVNTEGDTIWTSSYAPFGFYQTTQKLLSLQDKSVLSVGFQEQSTTQEDVFVRRLDSLGNVMWETIYAMPGNQRAYDITEMFDGSLVVSGVSDDNYLILKIGFDGNIIDSFTHDQGNPVFSSTSSLLPNNQLLNNGIAFGLFPNNDNYNLIGDSSFLSFSTLGFNTLKAVIDNNNNALLEYFFNDEMRLRYSSAFPLNTIWDIKMGDLNDTIRRSNKVLITNGGYFLLAGFIELPNSNIKNYWVAKGNGVGNPWIPDRCSYQPPIAGFDYEYNYPVLTLRDTSSGGLKYLDTVYTWQWNTSVGTSGNEDSLLVFFDTAINKTIDIELVIGNWYGCTDTVNQTLVLGETGLEVFKELNVKAFPNPVKDILNVHIESVQDELVFRLYDLQGRLQINELLQSDLSTISLSGLPRGLYFYDIRSERHVIPIASGRGKIVKE